jgi:hypothetical protein
MSIVASATDRAFFDTDDLPRSRGTGNSSQPDELRSRSVLRCERLHPAILRESEVRYLDRERRLSNARAVQCR